jgi:hypothetical protein
LPTYRSIRRSDNCLTVCGLLSWASKAGGQAVDERPLNVKTAPAFPNIKWPDWVTGADEGRVGEIRPLAIMGAGDGTNRIFVARQPGTVHVFPNDPQANEMKTFLDIHERIHFHPKENEEGFLGLAFHPNYKDNGEFFVYYTGAYDSERDRRSVISRFRVSKDDPNRADPDSEEILMVIPDKYWNSLSTARPATCGPARLGRTCGKRSSSSNAAATTAGISARANTLLARMAAARAAI